MGKFSAPLIASDGVTISNMEAHMKTRPATTANCAAERTVMSEGDRMKEWILVLRAADAAARWHVGQRRKGAAQEPYINHLLEVASLVTQATGGTEPNVIIAALLHDAIEDQGVTAETIASQFGQHVADIVTEVTDDKSLPKTER
jgi:(p)ppGpp synthase/HD superfamily hydrolase